MATLPPFVTARDLLNQIVDSLQLKPEESRLEQQCDCEYMRLLTDATNPYPLHLVNGADYLGWVRKYSYYYSVGLGMKTAVVCLESKPLANVVSLLSLASGIPQRDLFSLQVCRSHFGTLNRALEELDVSNPLFFEGWRLDLNGLISLIRYLKKHEAVETVIIDALHQVHSERDKPATRAEQRLISSVLQSTAHVGHFHVVAGFYDPCVPFPNLLSDSAFYCGSGQRETTEAEPRRIAIAAPAMALPRWIRKVCSSPFRRFVRLTEHGGGTGLV
jgi:hypothetical protein